MGAVRTSEAGSPVDWLVTPGLVPYEPACAVMANRVEAIAAGSAPELVWLLEHPRLYTAGTSARPADLLEPDRLPVFPTGRGGQYTYHGPGQRVVYVMLDVKRRFGDVRTYVASLEHWVIAALAWLGIAAERRAGEVGVWVTRRDGTHAKIGAIGVRLRRWISSHGFSLNVSPELGYFAGIVPCGIRKADVTSLAQLGHPISMAQIDLALHYTFEHRFGPTTPMGSEDPAFIGARSQSGG